MKNKHTIIALTDQQTKYLLALLNPMSSEMPYQIYTAIKRQAETQERWSNAPHEEEGR